MVPTMMFIAALNFASVAHPLPPDVSLAATYQGRALALDEPAATQLHADLETLLTGCWLAAPVRSAPMARDLLVTLGYRRPRKLDVIARGYAVLQVTAIRLTVSAARNDGWPELYAAGLTGVLQFSKCDGPTLLQTVCIPALEPHLPRNLRDNCRLSPRRASETGGSPLAE